MIAAVRRSRLLLLTYPYSLVRISDPLIVANPCGRGHPPADADAGVDFVAFGGTARVAMVEAWEMGTIWQPSPRAAAKAAAAGAANGKEMYERLIAAPPAAVPSVVGVSA